MPILDHLDENIDGSEAAETGDSVITWIFSNTIDILDDFVTDGYRQMFDTVENYFVAMALLYIIMYGWGMMYGWIESSSRQLTRDGVRFFFIFAIFYGFPAFLPDVIDVFLELPAVLAMSIVDLTGATDIGSPFVILDNLLRAAWVILAASSADISITSGSSWGRFLLSLLTFAGILYLVINAVYLVMKSVFFVVLLLVGAPIPLTFYFFQTTRGIANAWLGQLITYAFLQFFTIILIALILAIAGDQIDLITDDAGGENIATTANILGVLVVCLVGGLSVREIPGLAQSIGGGISLMAGPDIADGAVSTVGGNTRKAIKKLFSGASSMYRKSRAGKIKSDK